MSTVEAPEPSALRWKNVVELARAGNEPPPRRVEKSDDEWRKQLSAEQYHVARGKGTERPFSSQMCALFEPGRYHCICCDTPLFDSTTKFDSGTGWPSFTQPIARGVVAYHSDTTYGMQRIEALCNVCDAHLGHVFPDGPPPSGLRFCINAVSLRKAKSSPGP
jgi:peptide-methionine (R)-S-oxide reductase